MFGQGQNHRWYDKYFRDLMGLDQAEKQLQIKARQGDLHRLLHQKRVHDRIHPVNVKKRQHHNADFAGINREHGLQLRHIRHQIGMA